MFNFLAPLAGASVGLILLIVILGDSISSDARITVIIIVFSGAVICSVLEDIKDRIDELIEAVRNSNKT